MRQLVHGLRFARTWSQAWQVPTTSAMSQARMRLGEAPMKELFARLAGYRWPPRGLRGPGSAGGG
jgi:hypothetical protein